MQFKIPNMRAVGMHHYGASELALNTSYILKWDPMCPYDLGNAIAIHNFRGEVRAYLTREDAATISQLFFANVIEGRVVGKTTVNGHVCKQELGPQQECTLVFRVGKSHEPFVSTLLATSGLHFIKSN